MPKYHYCDQGSGDWFALRIGIPTASEFKRIITPTGRPAKSDTMRGYAYKLIAEKLLNRTLDDMEGIKWIDHGKEHEPDAIKQYEAETEVTATRVGFVTTDDLLIGASPDLLVGEEGLVEIKCPAPNTQVLYLNEGFGTDYMPQAQGQLFVTGRLWVDRFAYNPEMPTHVERTMRDEAYISLLNVALKEFQGFFVEALQKVEAKGFFAARKAVVTPAEQELAPEVDPSHILNAG